MTMVFHKVHALSRAPRNNFGPVICLLKQKFLHGNIPHLENSFARADERKLLLEVYKKQQKKHNDG
jgi:hypothetical protein